MLINEESIIRKIKQQDRGRLVEIINSVILFNEEEKECAIELIDESLFDITQHYKVYVIESSNVVYGYYCVGHRALTKGVYDLYWIVVDPKTQHNGFGRLLIEHAENLVKNLNGYLILIETSSKEQYKPTTDFYTKNNYILTAQISDFYSPGDHLLVFKKILNNEG